MGAIHSTSVLTQHILNRLPCKSRTDAIESTSTGEEFKEVCSEKVMCSICLEDIEEKDKGKTEPCAHCFHSKCIQTSLLYSGHCPMCRGVITGGSGFLTGNLQIDRGHHSDSLFFRYLTVLRRLEFYMLIIFDFNLALYEFVEESRLM